MNLNKKNSFCGFFLHLFWRRRSFQLQRSNRICWRISTLKFNRLNCVFYVGQITRDCHQFIIRYQTQTQNIKSNQIRFCWKMFKTILHNERQNYYTSRNSSENDTLSITKKVIFEWYIWTCVKRTQIERIRCISCFVCHFYFVCLCSPWQCASFLNVFKTILCVHSSWNNSNNNNKIMHTCASMVWAKWTK